MSRQNPASPGRQLATDRVSWLSEDKRNLRPLGQAAEEPQPRRRKKRFSFFPLEPTEPPVDPSSGSPYRVAGLEAVLAPPPRWKRVATVAGLCLLASYGIGWAWTMVSVVQGRSITDATFDRLAEMGENNAVELRDVTLTADLDSACANAFPDEDGSIGSIVSYSASWPDPDNDASPPAADRDRPPPPPPAGEQAPYRHASFPRSPPPPPPGDEHHGLVTPLFPAQVFTGVTPGDWDPDRTLFSHSRVTGEFHPLTRVASELVTELPWDWKNTFSAETERGVRVSSASYLVVSVPSAIGHGRPPLIKARVVEVSSGATVCQGTVSSPLPSAVLGSVCQAGGPRLCDTFARTEREEAAR